MEQILWLYEPIGTFVFAISGILMAIEKKLDIVGAFICAFVTALGGGMIRDVLIGCTPVGWMSNTLYLWIVIGALPVGYFGYNLLLKLRTSIFLFDAIGIALYGVAGFQKTLLYELPILVAIMMGVVSSVFGGVLRDIICNEVPKILVPSTKELYALASLLGICFYMFLDRFILFPQWLSVLCTVILVILVRFLSVKYEWGIGFNPKGNKD